MRKRRFAYPALAFSLSLGLFLAFLYTLSSRQTRDRMAQAGVQSDLLARAVQQALTELFVCTAELDIQLRSHGFRSEYFEGWVDELRRRHRNLDVAQLAPGAVIRHSHPQEGFESALGADLRHSRRRQRGVEEAIATRTVNFIGPVRLAQNGELCIIARRPVFQGESTDGFWGFTIGIAYFRSIAQRELAALEGRYVYCLQGHDPDAPAEAVLTNRPGHQFGPGTTRTIAVPNGVWTLQLEPVEQTDRLLVALAGFGLVVSGLLAWLAHAWERGLAREAELLQARNRGLLAMAEQDPLTGLLNRRAFLAQAAHALEPPVPAAEQKACVFLDLDHFKRINDQHGHEVGDRVLQATAECMRVAIRKSDLVARFGGEEFVLLFNSESPTQARELAEKLRGRLAEVSVDIDGGDLSVTGSFGVAQRVGREPIESMLRRADQALYKAKQSGRNRVEEADMQSASG